MSDISADIVIKNNNIYICHIYYIWNMSKTTIKPNREEENKITSIRVSWETKKALKKHGVMGETEESVLKRLLKIDTDKVKVANERYKKKIEEKV